jgi:hypothetical protein
METASFWLLGYHVLAESLSIYPTMIILGTIAKQLFWKNRKESKTMSLTENILFGLSIFWVGFSLLPSWPFLFFSALIYLRLIDHKSRKVTLISIILPMVFLFMIIDIRAWFNDTFIANIKYFIPYETETNGFKSYLAILIYPFLSLFKSSVPVAKYYLFLTLISMGSVAIMLGNSKRKTFLILRLLLLYGLVILLNLRIPKIDIGFYTAFHVLPQLGALTILSIILINLAADEIGKKSAQKIAFLSVSGFIIFAALFLNTTWWRESKDKMEEHFIQYGEIQSLGSALNKLKLGNDKLLVGQLEGLLNIVSELPIAGSQNAYLNWSFRSEESRKNLTNLMNNNPPTFIYFTEDGPYFDLLKQYLHNQYTRLQRFDGGVTYAYMLNSEINKRTQDQWKGFEDLFYKIPEKYNQ